MSLFGQEIQESNNLDDQYRALKSNSNNYQIYKVVKELSLDEFWKSVRDTLDVERQEIRSLYVEVTSLKKELNNVNAQLAARDAQLEEQEYMIEYMSFLGIPLSKGTYIIFTWVLIFILFTMALVLYFRFHGAHKVTAQTKKEIAGLQLEFETHRQRTRENETKMKRDLQTEINRVTELEAQMNGDS
jgi:cell division protein FtsB